MPLPGQHELDEQRMTVYAVPLENIEPGDYRIEECGGENGGWYWDEDEMGQVIRRHSPVGWLGWLALRLLGREEIKLDNEKGWIKMEMVGEASVLRLRNRCNRMRWWRSSHMMTKRFRTCLTTHINLPCKEQ